MFENKRLEKIEQQIQNLKVDSSVTIKTLYGGFYTDGLEKEVKKLKEQVAKLQTSETLPKFSGGSENKLQTLKPCPNCGSENVEYFEKEHSIMISCGYCGTKLVKITENDDVVKLWNERKRK